MRLWGIIRTDNKIVRDFVLDTAYSNKHSVDDWNIPIGELCHELDLSRPILLKKHLHELHAFSRAVFLPSDFMESIDFDKFEVEIFPEEKKK